jgi:branched-chain amino acid aminotransferase
LNDYIYQKGKTIYEVLRVIDGVPLFFEDHFARLAQSAKISNLDFSFTPDQFRKYIVELCGATSDNGNIKIVIRYEGPKIHYRLFFIATKYPSKEMYDRGVNTILYYAERHNPEAKVIQYSLREDINNTLLRRDAYEALLVNSQNCITEGSRSNLYFIKESRLYTAGDQYVLGGITRKYIKQICSDLSIEIIYRSMPVGELNDIDSLFLSGTSPHVLPIRSVDSRVYSVENPILKSLYNSYISIVQSYISSNR